MKRFMRYLFIESLSLFDVVSYFYVVMLTMYLSYWWALVLFPITLISRFFKKVYVKEENNDN